MRAVLDVLFIALQLYTWLIICSAVLSWLVAFNIVNARNDVVRSIWNLCQNLTEPLLQSIRNVLPFMGGVDISPVILLLGIFLIERIIERYIYPYVF